jgi:hypothetical protein
VIEMADLVKLLRLRCLEERLAEERLVEARGVLGRTLAVEEALIESRRLADAARLAGLGAGHVEDSIHQDQAAQQFEISARTLLARLTTQQEQVRTLAAGHRAAHQDRRRLEVVLEADARIRDHEEERREQRQLDDAYLVARAAARRVSAAARRESATPGGSLRRPAGLCDG